MRCELVGKCACLTCVPNRKRLTDTVGYFDSSLDPLSDWELWVRGIINGSTYWFLEQPVIVWCVHR